MASPTQWTWVWVSSRSWWWTGKSGIHRVAKSQTWLSNWTELKVSSDYSFISVKCILYNAIYNTAFLLLVWVKQFDCIILVSYKHWKHISLNETLCGTLHLQSDFTIIGINTNVRQKWGWESELATCSFSLCRIKWTQRQSSLLRQSLLAYQIQYICSSVPMGNWFRIAPSYKNLWVLKSLLNWHTLL